MELVFSTPGIPYPTVPTLLHCLPRQHHADLCPEVLVEGASNHAPLKEDECPLLVALGNLKVKVLPPVSQLCSFQWLHMEVGTFDLKGGRTGVVSRK